MVGERVGQRRPLGGFGRFVACAIEARERVGIRVDHLGGRSFELRHLIRKCANPGPGLVGHPVRSVDLIVHPCKDRLVWWQTHVPSR